MQQRQDESFHQSVTAEEQTGQTHSMQSMQVPSQHILTLIDSLTEGIFVLDKEWRYMYLNKLAEELVERPREELLGKNVWKLFPEAIDTIIYTEFMKAVQEQQSRQFEVFYPPLNKWFENKIYPTPEGLIFFSRDITERKYAEVELGKYAAIVTSSDDAIVSKTLDGTITSWNAAAEKLFGYTAEEAVGQHISLIIPLELHQEEEAIIQQLRAGRRIEHYETVRLKKDGTRAVVSLSISPVKDKEGKIIGAAKIARDITRRKQLEDELRRSKQQLEVIFENIADGIIVYNQHNQIIYVNEAAAHLTGFSSVQAMLETLPKAIVAQFEISDEQGHPFPLSHLPHRRVLAGEQEAQAIIGYRDMSSTQARQWSISKARPVFDEQGKLLLVITIIHDITERQELERRKDEFISIASHELKTPITTLKGFIQLLLRKFERQGLPEAVPTLTKMEAQINRLTKLVDELLDVSKIQAGQVDYEEEPVDLVALLRETVELLQASSPTHTLLIKETRQAWIMGDKDRLAQMLTNLITNAIKYSPQANKVDLSLTTSSTTATLRVRDYGVGIPKADQKHIFDRFYRVHDGHQRFSGLGLGLYITHGIVKRHGGKMIVESEEGKGSTFIVSLPLKKN